MESFTKSSAIVATSNNKLDTLQEIEDRIFTIRGVQVMIDRDLAEIYEVETRVINQAVKRNSERFPERYMFQLTKEEQQYYDSLRSQFVILKNNEEPSRSQIATLDNLKSQIVTSSMRGKHSKYNSFAFTEQGVSMLASVLKSETAVQTSIKIIDAFVAMRHFMQKNAKLFVEIDNIKQHLIQTDVHLNENDKKIEQVLTLLEKNHEEDKQRLFFEGQIYDAFSFMVSLVQKAEKEIILIDNYAGVRTLDVLSKKKENVDVQLFTSKKAKIAQSDIDKFNAQYPTITLNYTDTFHDRFLIIDSSTAYSIGSSVKDAGKRCFAVTQINEEWMVNMILEKIQNKITGHRL